jgi:hypothetical protein
VKTKDDDVMRARSAFKLFKFAGLNIENGLSIEIIAKAGSEADEINISVVFKTTDNED